MNSLSDLSDVFMFFFLFFTLLNSCLAPAPEKAAPPKIKPAEEISVDNNNDPNRFCSICQAPFNNPLMAQQHYEGKKHRKRMTKMKLMETYGPSSAPGQSADHRKCHIHNYIKSHSIWAFSSF